MINVQKALGRTSKTILFIKINKKEGKKKIHINYSKVINSCAKIKLINDGKLNP